MLLSHVDVRVGTEITTHLVLALVTSRLDYCNSVLAALPQSTIEPLQRVQNTAARLIFNLGKREHVSPCLIQLHWLPVRYRITYKLCTLMHNVHIGKSPRYLADIVQPTSFWVGVRHSVDCQFVFYASQTFLCRFY